MRCCSRSRASRTVSSCCRWFASWICVDVNAINPRSPQMVKYPKYAIVAAQIDGTTNAPTTLATLRRIRMNVTESQTEFGGKQKVDSACIFVRNTERQT